MATKSDAQLSREKLEKTIKYYQKKGYDLSKYIDGKDISKMNTKQSSRLRTFLKEQVQRWDDKNKVYDKYTKAYNDIMGDLAQTDVRRMINNNIINRMRTKNANKFTLKEDTKFLIENKDAILEKMGDLNEKYAKDFLELYFKDFKYTNYDGVWMSDKFDEIREDTRDTKFLRTFIDILTDDDFKKMQNYENYSKNWGTTDSATKLGILQNRFDSANDLTKKILKEGGDWKMHLNIK